MTFHAGEREMPWPLFTVPERSYLIEWSAAGSEDYLLHLADILNGMSSSFGASQLMT